MTVKNRILIREERPIPSFNTNKLRIFEIESGLQDLKVTDLNFDDEAFRCNGVYVEFFSLYTLRKKKIILFLNHDNLYIDFGFGAALLENVETDIQRIGPLIKLKIESENKMIIDYIWQSIIRTLLSDGQDEESVNEPVVTLLSGISDPGYVSSLKKVFKQVRSD